MQIKMNSWIFLNDLKSHIEQLKKIPPRINQRVSDSELHLIIEL